jgi:hypothetical protein
MTAVFCRNAADRKAETWTEQLAPFDRLEFAVYDAAKKLSENGCNAHVVFWFASHRPIRCSRRYQSSPHAIWIRPR